MPTNPQTTNAQSSLDLNLAKNKPSPTTNRKDHVSFVWFHGLTLLVLLALLATTFILAPLAQDDQPVGVITQLIAGGLVCPALILLVIHHGYFLGRQFRYPARAMREKIEKEKSPEPADIKKPVDFEGVAEIDAAQHLLLPSVSDRQGRFRARAVTTYLAPAIATVLMALHVAVWPDRPFGGGLILGQITLLVIVVGRIIVDRRPTEKWVLGRTRAELLRRDQYLRLAKVGPYHPSACTVNTVTQRVGKITTAGSQALMGLIPMEFEEDRDHSAWYQKVEANPLEGPVLTDLPARMSAYSYHRLWKQIAWMRSARSDMESTGRLIEWGLIMTAFINAGVVVASFAALAMKHHGQNGGQSASGWAIGQAADFAVTIGLFLPALGGAWLALQGVFSLRLLAENYQMTAGRLEQFRSDLLDLIAEVTMNVKQVHPREHEVRFQHLVLRAEEELTAELIRWRMITQRDAHELV